MAAMADFLLLALTWMRMRQPAHRNQPKPVCLCQGRLRYFHVISVTSPLRVGDHRDIHSNDDHGVEQHTRV